MPKYKHRKDDNTFEIINYLNTIPGVSWKSVSQVDHFVDLIVGWMGKNYLFELKSAKGKLSKEQKDFHSMWSGHIHVIRTIEDVNKAFGIKE
jgi:hypothetical protein